MKVITTYFHRFVFALGCFLPALQQLICMPFTGLYNTFYKIVPPPRLNTI